MGKKALRGKEIDWGLTGMVNKGRSEEITHRYLYIPYLQNCRSKPEAVTHVGFPWRLSSKKKSSCLYLPMKEMQVQPLGREDPLEKEMATHSSILAWKIWWMEEPGGLSSIGSQRVGHDWATSLHSLQNVAEIKLLDSPDCVISFCLHLLFSLGICESWEPWANL